MTKHWWTVEFRRVDNGRGSVRVQAKDLREAMLAVLEGWSSAMHVDDVEIQIVRDPTAVLDRGETA